jgi:ketosteroid isomerase-like protein
MIGSDLEGTDLEGTDLESRVAGWAASATIDDAAAVRAVIEAYGDRLGAADVAGVVSQFTGSAVAMQPGLETAEGSQQLTATYDAALENMRLDFTFRSDDITVQGDLAAVRATSQGTITIRATGETQPARLRQLFVLERTEATARSRSPCTSRCRSSQEGAAPSSSESVTRIRARSASASACGRRSRRSAADRVDLPARTGAVQVDVGIAGAVRVPALGAADAAGGHGSCPAMH